MSKEWQFGNLNDVVKPENNGVRLQAILGPVQVKIFDLKNYVAKDKLLTNLLEDDINKFLKGVMFIEMKKEKNVLIIVYADYPF